MIIYRFVIIFNLMIKVLLKLWIYEINLYFIWCKYFFFFAGIKNKFDLLWYNWYRGVFFIFFVFKMIFIGWGFFILIILIFLNMFLLCHIFIKLNFLTFQKLYHFYYKLLEHIITFSHHWNTFHCFGCLELLLGSFWAWLIGLNMDNGWT